MFQTVRFPIEADANKDVLNRAINSDENGFLLNYLCLWTSDLRQIIRHRVRLDYGRRQVWRGVWRERFHEATFELMGFRLLSPDEMKGDAEIQSLPGSTAAIKRGEIEAQCGARGVSYTARLREDERLERRRPEDFIERALAKVRVYPYVGAERGSIVGAWDRTTKGKI